MTLIEGADYIIRPVPWLTGDLNAFVSVDEDGFYSIYVNDALAPQAQREAADHELQHITRDDFFNDLSIRVVEGQAVPEPVTDTQPAPEEIEAALRAWAAEWVRLKIAEIENRGKRKKRRRPAEDDAPLPPAIW